MQRWRGTHYFDRISALAYDGIHGTPGRKVLYVDSRSWAGNGNNNHAGTNPDAPLATIAAAVAKCEAGKNDYIFVLDAYDNDAVTIEIAKSGLHIIGMTNGNHRAPFPWLKIAGTGAVAVFTIKGGDGANFEIAGFSLAADATHPCITTKTGGATELGFGHIHDCAFAASLDAAFVAQDGIALAAATGMDGWLIEHNVFGAQLVRDGIRFINAYQALIRSNLFRAVPGVGVSQLTGGAATGMADVLDNKFFQKTVQDTASSISIVDAGGGMIDGNHTVSNGGHAGNNPYKDTSTGTDTSTKNGWGLNYLGDTVKYPAFA